MIQQIRELIQLGQIHEAHSLVDSSLKRTFKLDNEEDEKDYKQLLALRITVHTLLGNEDEAVFDIARRERFYHKDKIVLDSNNTIYFVDKSISRITADAVVNSIHQKLLFDYSPESLSKSFISWLGKEKVTDQIKGQDFNAKPFLTLTHPELTFPLSYHIPIYVGNNEVDEKALKSGIAAVLDDAVRLHLSSIAFAPIGMSLTPTPEITHETVILWIAEALTDYLFGHPTKKRLNIQFAFSNVLTYQTFKQVFDKNSLHARYIRNQEKEIGKTIAYLIEALNTKNEKFMQLLTHIAYSIDDNDPLLLLGESGSGKTTIAELLHKVKYGEKSETFADLNCSIVQPNIIMNEVFGIEKGAFTDVQAQEGVLDRAANGTAFLDEIGNSDFFFQKALLKVLDSKQYRRAGGKNNVTFTGRFIFGTNADLDTLVQQGLFDDALYARIAHGGRFTIPPLRERREDIAIIARSEIDKCNESRKNPGIMLTDDAYDFLTAQEWPGNARQLKYYIIRQFNNAQFHRTIQITASMLRSNPPFDSLYRHDTTNVLESSISKALKNWNPEENGKFINDYLLPIVSKVFLTDCKAIFNLTDADRILGISGNKGASSRVKQLAQAYDLARKIKL